MKFRPLHDRVVVRRIEENTKTAGGIIIPDTVKEKPMQGEIIAVGPGARDENGKLVMTHYCAMGNQPHMVLKQATPKSISMEMGPTVGIDAAKDPHMHGLALEFPDANHLVERWTSYKDGKRAESVVFTLTRA